MKRQQKEYSLKKQLKNSLSVTEQKILRQSYEVVGNIAIIEVPKELKKKEKTIAQVLLKKKNIVTVVRKGKHEGQLRTQKTTYLAGRKNKETIAVENGVQLKLHLDKAYYSSKQATERKRIYQQVKKHERVLVMFSGIAPFAIEIAKHAKPKEVIAVELNKEAHKYAQENIVLNKVNVVLLQGDVQKIVPLKKKFDRIIMPLPKQAYQYLDIAFRVSTKHTMIHMYDEVAEKNIPDESVEKMQQASTKAKKKIKILTVKKCGQLGVRKYRVCVDAQVC